MPAPTIVILGGDSLAFKVSELLVGTGSAVVLVWDDEGDFAAYAARIGARFTPRYVDERRALDEAGIVDASVAMALTDDDHANLQFALAARDLNPRIRIVLRQFNRTLGRKIEQNLPDCSVVSLSSLSAATYAGAAVDPACFYGIHFPDVDGPLVGFSDREASEAGVVGTSCADAERTLGARIVARNDRLDFDRALTFAPGDRFTVFASVSPREPRGRHGSGAALADYAGRFARSTRGLGRLDPVSRGAIVAALCVLTAGALYFGTTLRLPFVTAIYFVIATMTTTGYGDIAPGLGDVRGQFVSVLLMLAGITFSGIFIAVLSSRFAQAQYVATQGLRNVSSRGHFIVCGAGNVGARVVDQLLAMRRKVVVVEVAPHPETIAGSRAGRFQLLTGDASKDGTLDLCNVAEAAGIIALTNSDTMNLEIALGARARNKTAHVVMRVQHQAFEASIRRHFGFERAFGTAALAAPVFAGLAHGPEMRGLATIGASDCAIFESTGLPALALPLPDGRPVALVPLAVWRDRRVVLLADYADVRPGESTLSLVNAASVARDASP